MVTFESLLEALYEIQGLADPNNPTTVSKENLLRIFEIASFAMAESGWEPS